MASDDVSTHGWIWDETRRSYYWWSTTDELFIYESGLCLSRDGSPVASRVASPSSEYPPALAGTATAHTSQGRASGALPPDRLASNMSPPLSEALSPLLANGLFQPGGSFRHTSTTTLSYKPSGEGSRGTSAPPAISTGRASADNQSQRIGSFHPIKTTKSSNTEASLHHFDETQNANQDVGIITVTGEKLWVRARLDTGAEGFFVSYEQADRAGWPIAKYNGDDFVVGNNSTLRVIGIIPLTWHIRQRPQMFYDAFYVVEDPPFDLILGEDGCNGIITRGLITLNLGGFNRQGLALPIAFRRGTKAENKQKRDAAKAHADRVKQQQEARHQELLRRTWQQGSDISTPQRESSSSGSSTSSVYTVPASQETGSWIQSNDSGVSMNPGPASFRELAEITGWSWVPSLRAFRREYKSQHCYIYRNVWRIDEDGHVIPPVDSIEAVPAPNKVSFRDDKWEARYISDHWQWDPVREAFARWSPSFDYCILSKYWRGDKFGNALTSGTKMATAALPAITEAGHNAEGSTAYGCVNKGKERDSRRNRIPLHRRTTAPT